MAKRVHFAAENTFHSPMPSPAPSESTDGFKSPSPTPSDSSIPSSSSSEISTPPPPQGYYPYPHPPTPYYAPRQLYLPPQQQDVYQELEPKTMQIHRLLAYTPYTLPAVPFDLTVPLSAPPHYLPPGTALTDPATHPPLGSITVVLPRLLSLEITVLPGGGTGHVTVLDILHALYRELRHAIHPMEYNALRSDERESVNRAYFERCSRLLDVADRILEEKKGVKRVDFLCGMTRFQGLCVSGDRAGVWELNVS